jgi:hypothetical protein
MNESSAQLPTTKTSLAPRKGARALLSSLLCVTMLGIAFAPIASGAEAGHLAGSDPAAIGCPGAPADWNRPGPVKSVLAPDTVPENSWEQKAFGGDAVSVTCAYSDKRGVRVSVMVSYALPSDPNPNADFYFGCGNGDVAWTSTARMARVSSPDEWAYAGFTDPNGYLSSDKDVGVFKGLASSLLSNVRGYGHSCKLTVKPTTTYPRYFVDVRIGNANIKPTFWTSARSNGAGAFRIERVNAPDVVLAVSTNTGARTITIRFTKGIDYHPLTAHSPALARFGVMIVGSNVPSCSKGTRGILSMSSKPLILLSVCGHDFLRVRTQPVQFYPFR